MPTDQRNQTESSTYQVVVVGGGPAGATAATELSMAGFSVLLLERAFRIKPCGGAIPPCLMREFDVPESLLVARVNCARMVAPSGRSVDMNVGGFVGMVDREVFDPWLRDRAAACGADVRYGAFLSMDYLPDGRIRLCYQSKQDGRQELSVVTDAVIGADGANSKVARGHVPGARGGRSVIAYHEIVESPEPSDDFQPNRCDVVYDGRFSPDFYAWIFPHGSKTSVGMGTAVKETSLTESVELLRAACGLDKQSTIRREGAPIPLKPHRRWDDGRGVILAGDAAGVVAPASGEGIYYAMLCGRLVANAVGDSLRQADPRLLRSARKRFMKLHGRTFFALGLLQRFWYSTDARREKFVAMCLDVDVQRLTWDAYMNKRLVRREPLAHLRVLWKDIVELLRLRRSKA